jgi:hypothetical protein
MFLPFFRFTDANQRITTSYRSDQFHFSAPGLAAILAYRLVGARQPVRSPRFTLKQYLQSRHAMILSGDGHQAMVDRAFARRRQKIAAMAGVKAAFVVLRFNLVVRSACLGPN